MGMKPGRLRMTDDSQSPNCSTRLPGSPEVIKKLDEFEMKRRESLIRVAHPAQWQQRAVSDPIGADVLRPIVHKSSGISKSDKKY